MRRDTFLMFLIFKIKIKKMYLAMSRLKVISGKEAEFEAVWSTHNTATDGIKGFRKFNYHTSIYSLEEGGSKSTFLA